MRIYEMANDRMGFSIPPNAQQTLGFATLLCCSIPSLSCLIRNSLFNPNNFHRYVSLIKGRQTLLKNPRKCLIFNKIRDGKKVFVPIGSQRRKTYIKERVKWTMTKLNCNLNEIQDHNHPVS